MAETERTAGSKPRRLWLRTGIRLMNYAVIIPSRDIANLIACLGALENNQPDARIMVVDDGIDWDKAKGKLTLGNFEILSGQKPFVFARNCNMGLQHAFDMAVGNDGAILLNDDALLQTPGGFSLLAQAAEEYPDLGAIAAVTNVTGQPLQKPRGIGLRVVEHVAFIAIYIARRTIERVGYLDERYCLPDSYGVEDRDYCMACERAGLKIAVHDDCYVDHGSLRSTFRGDARAPRDFSKHLALFNQKWGLAV